MPLTPQQIASLPQLENILENFRTYDWLLNLGDHRRGGRTIVCAIALVQKALKHPGQLVPVIDISMIFSKRTFQTTQLFQSVLFGIGQRVPSLGLSFPGKGYMIANPSPDLDPNWIDRAVDF